LNGGGGFGNESENSEFKVEMTRKNWNRGHIYWFQFMYNREIRIADIEGPTAALMGGTKCRVEDEQRV